MFKNKKNLIRVMIEKKGLIDQVMEVKVDDVSHMVPMETLLEYINGFQDDTVIEKIISTLSEVDSKNGNVLHYMKHLATGLAVTESQLVGVVNEQ